MDDGEFAWDDAKAASNLAKHGVSFEAARDVFRDAFAVEWADDRQDYGEPRFVIVGMIDGRLLAVTYTPRGEAIRIISAREAEAREKRRYHNENET